EVDALERLHREVPLAEGLHQRPHLDHGFIGHHRNTIAGSSFRRRRSARLEAATHTPIITNTVATWSSSGMMSAIFALRMPLPSSRPAATPSTVPMSA